MLQCLVERSLRTIRDGLISLAYPVDCRLCGDPIESWDDGVACHRCWADPQVTRLFSSDSICHKCGIPLDSRTSYDGAEPPLQSCSRCSHMPFGAARACGSYSGALEASILFLKSHPHLCRTLRDLIAATVFVNRDVLSADLVVPMPLHRSREKERGFNQAMLIARLARDVAGVPLDKSSLLRTKRTDRHRAGMDAVDRARSVEGAFKVESRPAVCPARVLLVDDVYTTGSTAGAAARALLDAGAISVKLFTVARVV